MKKYISVVLLFAFFIVFIFGFKKNDLKKEENILDSKVKEIMEGLTLEEKISQMLIINNDMTTVDDDFKETLNRMSPGGFILMKNNYINYEQTRKLVSDLKSSSKIPLIIATDQEGGRVQRLQYLEEEGYTNIPFMYDVGKTKNYDLAYEVGKIMALELRTLGINVVFAPVLDVYSNPLNEVIGKRSFSSNPDIVSKMAYSLAKGLKDNGVIPTFKHFPGHGDTETDSHTSLPIIKKSYQELDSLDLKPFKYIIEKGADIIMTAHIALPNITNDNVPSTMSKTIITELLRNKLNYKGLVITDALNMKALTNYYSEEEIILNSINAGVDILLMPQNFENTISYIKNNIDEERINESVYKILKFKLKYLSKDNFLEKEYIGRDEYKEVLNKINVEQEE